MSARKSKLAKIIRSNLRMKKKQETLRKKLRKPGETDEMMEARLKRDLGGWLDMMSEREVEEGLLAAAEEQKAIEELSATTEEEK